MDPTCIKKVIMQNPWNPWNPWLLVKVPKQLHTRIREFAIHAGV
jgi:hypothetical protein